MFESKFKWSEYIERERRKRKFDTRPSSKRPNRATPPDDRDIQPVIIEPAKGRKVHFTVDGVETYCRGWLGYPLTKNPREVECELCKNKMRKAGIQ